MQRVVCNISCPAKAILCGEHAVVYGEDAIALGIGLYCRSTVTQRQKSKEIAALFFRLNSQHADIEIQSQMIEVAQLIQSSESDDKFAEFTKTVEKEKEFNEVRYSDMIHYKVALFLIDRGLSWSEWAKSSLFDFNIQIISQIPIGKCLGSSAAFNSVLATALLAVTGCLHLKQLGEQTKEEVNKLSYIFERVEHGNPSGIDNYVSVYGGAILFNKTKEIKFQKLPYALPQIKSALRIGVVDSGIEKQTKVAVARVKEHYESSQKYRDHIREIGSMAKDASSLLRGNVEGWEEKLVKLMGRNHQLLRQLGVSSVELDEIAREWGELGWGAKVTGSGMGGCALLIAPKTIQLFGKGFVETPIDQDGLTVNFPTA